MLFSKLLYSSLFSPLLENSTKPEETNCRISQDIIKVVLYETYIPLEALVFQIGISKMSKGELKTVVGQVLNAKKLVNSRPESVSKFFNISDVNNEQGEFKDLLKFRQNLISSDKSLIFEALLKENLQMILECVDKLKNKSVKDPHIDNNYISMVDRLYDAVYDNVNVQDALDKEKNEFYRDFYPVNQRETQLAKIALSLGGTIVNLRDLLNFSNKLKSYKKEGLVREWVRIIFDSVEDLMIKTASKGFIEQKSIVEKFINESVDSESGNAAYEVRTAILKALELSQNETEEFMARQKNENMNILKTIGNIKTPQWIVKYNKQIREDMIEYLLTLQPEDKKKILNHFQ